MRGPRFVVASAVGGLAAAAALALVVAPPASAETVPLSPTGTITVTSSGNGHGHGLSQYGAYGAALAGRTTAQILAGYYPGTTLSTAPAGTLRVQISGAGSTLVVQAVSGLQVSGVGTLPTAGYASYRLIADAGSTLTLQRRTLTNATYVTYRSKLPNNTQFQRGGSAIRAFRSDGTSTSYLGYLRAVRAAPTGSAGGVRTVVITGYNAYAAGVAPREMPASWSRAATDSQAVAARTYALYEKAHAGSGYYDVCDTTSCQVFGGHVHYSHSGAVLWSDFPQAANDTTNKIVAYQGKAIFAQYSASNGGASSSGGQPYLRAAVDPYDPGKSGDPYINNKKTVAVSTLAHYAGLATVTKLAVTERDGSGSWGGRVVSATVYGTTSAKKATSKTLTGYDLQSAFGLGTTLLTVAAGK